LTRILGIDEAGRGCVLGDLIIASFLVESPRDDALRAAGAADSKALSEKRRDAAREALSGLGTADVRRVTPAEIDAGNLNALEEAIIVELVRRWRPDVVLVDALGHPRTLDATVARLRAAAGVDAAWTMVPKADARFPVVGAASIFAKTTRDAALRADTAAYGDLGSGYPSDPKTRAWIAAHAATGAPWPPFVRTRWATLANVAQEALFTPAGPATSRG
jgi:ribonuclease HII